MSSSFKEAKVTVPIHLLPSRVENVKAGIDEQLSEFLMECVKKLLFVNPLHTIFITIL